MLIHELIDDALRWIYQLLLCALLWFLWDGHPNLVWRNAAYVLCVILTVCFVYGWWHYCQQYDERLQFNITTVLSVIGGAICMVQLLAVGGIQLSHKHKVDATLLQNEWLADDVCNAWTIKLPDEHIYTVCHPHLRFVATGEQVQIIWRSTWLAYQIDVP